MGKKDSSEEQGSDQPQRLILNNCRFEGFYAAVAATPGTKLEARNITLKDVAKAFDIPNAGPSSIKSTRFEPSTEINGSIIGWRRSHGPALPSYCPKCQSVFASQKYELSGQFWNIWDNDDVCIVCGYEEAKLSEGHFNLTRDLIHILRSPEITRDMVWRLDELLRGALESGQLTPEKVIEAATVLHPRLGQAAQMLWPLAMAAYLLYSSVIGAINDTWDLSDRLGITDGAVIEQKILDLALDQHDRRWHHKVDQSVGGECAGETGNIKAAEQELTGAAKHKLRNALHQQRKAFGRSRTR